MEKFDISIDSGIVKLKFPQNLLKENVARNAGFSENQIERTWSAGIRALKPLVDKIREKGLYMSLDESSQDILSLNEDGRTPEEVEYLDTMWDGHVSFLDSVPDAIDFSKYGFRDSVTPFPFQWAGMHYGHEVANGRVLLADDMGLGKTLQAIGLLAYYREDLPAVIAVPASLLYHWKKQLLLLTDWLTSDDITILEKGSDKPKGLISICSYNYVTQNSDLLIDYLNVRGILIFDEAHALKSMQSLRGKAGVNLSHYAKRCFMITGTPILNRPFEIYPLIHALDPVEWDDDIEFARMYCEGHEQNGVYYTNGACNLNDMNLRLRDTLMVRRLKKKVLSQLPEKQRVARYLNATGGDKSLDEFAQLVKEMSRPLLVKNNFDIESTVSSLRGSFDKRGSKVLEAYEKSAINKIPNMVEAILDQMDSAPDEPIIVFAHHDKVITGIQEGISKAKKDLKYIRIDGSVTNKKKRFELAEKFQEDTSYQIAFLTLGTGSVGLTLTRAKKIFMAQMAWSTALCIQAEDRINRIGQDSVTEIIYLLGYNGFDDYMWNMLVSKSETTKEALDGAQGEVFGVTGDVTDGVDTDDLLRVLVEGAAMEIENELKMAA